MLLCCGALAVDLSEQFAASNGAIQKEQSRLLAKSGWNFALEALQLNGMTDTIQRTVSNGELSVTVAEHHAELATWDIVALGKAGEYHRTVSGCIQCFPFPFSATESWNVVQGLGSVATASIVLLDCDSYQLQSWAYPLGITSVQCEPVVIEVLEEVTVPELYIYGDLYVYDTLMADRIYVTGAIHGEEFIQCENLYSGYTDTFPYQIRVLERTVV